jgi:hypothetical protein
MDHRDLCEIKWSAGELALLERIPVDDGREEGEYTYISPPHSDEACPFNGGGPVRWKVSRLRPSRSSFRSRS